MPRRLSEYVASTRRVESYGCLRPPLYKAFCTLFRDRNSDFLDRCSSNSDRIDKITRVLIADKLFQTPGLLNFLCKGIGPGILLLRESISLDLHSSFPGEDELGRSFSRW